MVTNNTLSLSYFIISHIEFSTSFPLLNYYIFYFILSPFNIINFFFHNLYAEKERLNYGRTNEVYFNIIICLYSVICLVKSCCTLYN